MRKTTLMAAVLAIGFGAVTTDAVSAKQFAMETPAHRAATDPGDLETRAKSLFSSPKRYDEAAKLLLRAAETRSVGDPMRVQDVILASRLTFYRGDETKARALMVRAAEEAAATGDVITAAHAYMDAAFIAREAKETEGIGDLVRKAEMLAHSPLIGQADREGILVRIRNG
jgi:hypothetical protein